MLRDKKHWNTRLLAGQFIVFLVLVSWSNPSPAPVIPKNCPAKCNAECNGKGAECRAKVEVLCANTAPGMGDKITVCRGYYQSCNAAESSCGANCGAKVGDCSEEEEEEEENQEDENDEEENDEEENDEENEEENEDNDSEQDSSDDDGGQDNDSGGNNDGGGSGDGGGGSGGGGSGGGGSGGGGSGGGGSGGGGSGGGGNGGGGSGGGGSGGGGSGGGFGGGGFGGGGAGGPPSLPGWPPAGGGGGSGGGSGDSGVCEGESACSTGDPHLRTFDGIRFNFHGAGEYHFAMSEENDIDIQVRYEPPGSSTRVAVTTAFAAKVGENRLTVDSARQRLIEINGKPVAVKSGVANTVVHESGIVLSRNRHQYRIAMSSGIEFAFSFAGSYISLGMVSREYPVRGLGGSNDGDSANDFTTRDGETLQPSGRQFSREQLYDQFGNSWRIAQEESLFDYADGESTATYTNLDFPSEHLDIEDLDDEARARAEQVCGDAGVPSGHAFEDCVYDVGFTDDSRYALGYVPADQLTDAAVDGPDEVPAGSTVLVQWTGPAATGDFVSLAAVGQPASAHEDYSYLDDGGPVTLAVPGIPGNYELRYVQGRDRNILTSQALTVTAVAATLEAPATVPAGSPVQVRWTGPANHHDFISLAEPEQGSSAYHAYAYVSESDSVVVGAPGIPGDYELRYVVSADRQVIATRPLTVTPVTATLTAPETVVAGSAVTVQWSGPANKSDYISLAEPGQGPSAHQSYSYVSDSDRVSLAVPGIPGNYELRYILYADRQIVVNRPLTVTPATASLEAPRRVAAGTTFSVTWQGPANQSDYIAIAFEEDLGETYRNYAWVKAGSNTVQLSAPNDPGEYTVRYVLNNDRQVIAEVPVTVE